MEYFLLWIGFAAIVGAIARSKNRSFFGFFCVSVFFSPIIGLIVVLVSQAGGKKCASCGENVKIEAKKCRFCGNEFKEKLKTDEPTSLEGI